MSRESSPYQFHDELERRDAGYHYKYPLAPITSWSEEDSPQWSYMGEGRPSDWRKKLYPSEWCKMPIILTGDEYDYSK